MKRHMTRTTPCAHALMAAMMIAALPAFAQPASREMTFRATQSSVLDTPSFTVKIDVHCPEGHVTCENVTYTGTSKKNGASISVKGRTMHAKCADGITPCSFQGYTFTSGKINYRVLEEGELIVMKGDKTLVDEKGTWR
jgi:hypothetical protein